MTKQPRSIGKKPRPETQRKIDTVLTFYKLNPPTTLTRIKLQDVAKHVGCSTVYAHRIVHHLIKKGLLIKTSYGLVSL